MQLKKIRKSKNELEIELTGINETLLNPITETLLQNEDIEYASYISDHPESKKRKLYIRVKKGKKTEPVDLLTKAIKELQKEIKKFSTDIKSQSK
jgi:DNA-directed RNA polymerase subunit L